MLNLAEHEIYPGNNYQITNNFKFFFAKQLSMKISLLINLKIPIKFGIFISISSENFMHNWVEHEKSFYYLGALSPYVQISYTLRSCYEAAFSL